MGNLTKNLSRSEFACQCECGFDTADFELVELLQKTVDHFEEVDGRQVRIEITGPNRCRAYNAVVGRAPESQHIYGRAADFKLFYRDTGEQIDPDRVADFIEIECSGRFGMGRYYNRTHVDSRTLGPARWDKR